MALSYNLYQIGFVADADTTVSYVQDSGLSLASSLPAEEEGYGANDSEQIIDLSGSSSNLNNSFTTQYDSVYIIVGGELIFASLPDGGSDTQLSVNRRGNSGTPVESHSAGDTIYQVDPQRKDDVTVNTGLRRIKDITDFSVEDVGQFEEAVEYEKGTFRVSNVSATVSGIDRHTLSDAGDIDKPWVFEVRDSGNSLLFQGILKDDAKFNAGTEKINFTAVSWLEVLNRVESLPARVQYEADIKAVTVGDPTGEVSSDLTIQFPSSPKFTSNFPSRGDTVAVETEKGEIRKVATKVKQDTDFTNVKIPVDGLFENLVYSSKSTSNQVEAGKVEEYDTDFGTAYYSEYRFKKLPTELENTLTELSNPDKYKVLLFDSNDSIVEQISINKGLVNEDPFNEEWPKVFAIDRRTLVQQEIPSHQYFIIAKNTGSQALLDKVSSAEAENKVKVLSQEMWGYEGIDDSNDNDGLPDYFDPQGLMDALFKTQEVTYGGDYDGRLPTLRLGVLPKIMQSNGVVFGRGGPDDVFETIDPRVEFPTAPIEALRMIQQDTGTMLTVNTGTTTNAEGETLPSVQFELLPRQRLLDDANRVQLEDVTDWNENTSERDIRAVVIEPNKQYGAGGDEQPEYLGIYTEQMDRNFTLSGGETDFGSNGVPEGDDVITIKTNHFPKGGGYTYREGDDPVVNDDHLREIARLYYKQFTEANRKVEFSVGKDNPDVLAKYVSIEEGRVVDDSVLVTQKRHYLEEDHRETSLVGRIGGRAQFGETAPVPDIRVPRAFRADSSDVATILVSGRNSYDGRPGTLSFQWEYKKVSASTWTSGGTGAVLETDIGVTGGSPVTYDVRLTVTNNNTGGSAQETDQFVIKPYNEPDDTTPSNEIDYDKQQVTDSGNQYGQINVTLANPELVQTDSNGNPLFEFRAAQGAEIDASASWYRVGSGNSPQGSGQVVTDENGNVTGFFAEVQLDPKHVSNVQTRIKWTETVGYANQVRSHAFDFDNVAKVDVSVYNDESGAVYADVIGDEDTDTFNIEYRKNDGAWQSVLTGQGNDIVGYKVVSGSNVSDGDSIDVRITPFNFDGAKGKQVVRGTFYNRSTGGGSSLDVLTINGAGTIDSIQSDEFRFQSTDGSDSAKIDVFGLEVDEINGTSISEFASQSDVDLLAKNIVQTQADIDALGAVTVRRSREFIAGNAIGPLGDLSKDRTVTVQEEDLAGTFLAPDGSGALAVQTTGDLVGDRSGKMQIGQSVVQTREIDESIAPTWTGVHTHAADIEMQSQQVRFDDGVLQGDGNGALEVLKADESNQGTLRVDEIVAHTVTVVDEIDQRNVNDLRVEDQYIVVNENQSGTPGLDGGLVAERGGLEDAYIEWEEGLDVWGTRLENGTLKPITLRDTSMADTGIPYWNQQEERIETDSDLKFLADQSQPFEEDPAGKVQTKAGIGHPDYLTEKQHWYITPGGLGDFRTLLADELRVEAFIAEVEEALAGSDFLTKSFATLDQPFSLPSSSPVGTQKDLTVQDLDGLGATPVFGNDTSQEDDTLRLRITDRSGGGLTVADVWLRCIAGSYTDNGDGTQTWTVEILQAGDAGIGAELTAPEGSVVLDYGVPGDFLIERSVLNPDSGDIAPYDRMLSWKDNDGDRIPDDYEVLNLRGRLDGLSKAYASGFGTYTETARFTSDIIVGDIEAGAAGDQTGSYLRFSDNDGLEVVYGDGFGGTNDGRLSSAVLQLEDDVRLLAQEIVQEQESRAGLEVTASETEARVRAQAEIIGDDFSSDATISAFADETKSRFESSVQYTKDGEVEGEAKINLEAGPNGSSAVLAAEDVRISGNTTFFGGSGIPGGVLEDDYTEKGTENVTIRGSGEPNSTTTRGFDSDGDGTNDDPIDGDFYIDTSDGDKPYVYDGPKDKWFAAYTSINGGDIETGTVNLDRLSFANAEEGYIDAQYLNITASDLTINSNTTFFGSEYPNASGIPGDALQGDYTDKGTESVILTGSGDPTTAAADPKRSDGSIQNGDMYLDTSDGEKPYIYNGEWRAAYTQINGGNITTGQITLDRMAFGEDGEIAAEYLGITVDDLDIDATDVTISGSSKSDVKNAVLQLEDDVRLLAENLTQEQEARAGLELTASETEARFEADVKFAGNTANLTLAANNDGSTVSLSGDSVEINGNTTFFGEDYNNPNGVPGDALEEDYTQSGTENVTLRGSGAPDSNTTRSDGSIQVGDIYLNTSNGDRPWSWDGSKWVRQYTSINGGNIEAGTIDVVDLEAIESDLGSVTINESLSMDATAGISMGSGANRFLLGDFDIAATDNEKIQNKDISGQNVRAEETVPDNKDTDSGSVTANFNEDIGGYFVTVDVDFEYYASGSGDLFDQDFETTQKIEFEVRFKDGSNVLKTISRSFFSGSPETDAESTQISSSAPSGTTDVQLYVKCTAKLGPDEQYWDNVQAACEDTFIQFIAQGSKDFVGGQGLKYTDDGNDLLRLDARTKDQNDNFNHGKTPDPFFQDERIVVRGGRVEIRDDTGTAQIRIWPQGFIDFREQNEYDSNNQDNASDFPQPQDGWVRLGAEKNDNKLGRINSSGNANDF